MSVEPRGTRRPASRIHVSLTTRWTTWKFLMAGALTKKAASTASASYPDCPECFGDGISVAFMTDTRLLSPAARKLYAGTRKTKDGVEVKVHDQVAARLHLGKHLGLFVDKTEVEHKGNVTFIIEDGPVKKPE